MDRALSAAHRSRSWRRFDAAVLPAAAALAVAIVVGLPLAVLAWRLVESSSSSPSGAILGLASTWRLLGRSLALASVVTAGSVLVGAPLGLLCGRTDLPGRHAIWMLHAFPALLPPFLVVLGWFHVLGRRGLLGSATTAELLFSDLGLVAVLVLVLAPVVTTLVAVAAQAVDPSLEEAGRVVAPPLPVLFRIVLPATRPALALGAILAFALAFAELGAAAFLRRDVYPAAVFARLGGIDFAPGEAVLLSLPLLPVALALVWAERRWCSQRSFAVLGARTRRASPVPLGRWRWPAAAAAWALAGAAVTPLGALVWRAVEGRGYQALGTWLEGSVWTSVATAVAAAALATAIGIVVGHEVVRGGRLGLALDALLLLAFILPSAVLAVGLVGAWNRPAGAAIYGSPWILVLAALARYSVVAERGCAVAFAQGQPHWLEAARVYGAGYVRRLAAIALPAHWRGVAASFVLTLAFVLRDLETAVVLYPPGRQPLTVRIFTLEANSPEAVIAALATTQVAVTAATVALAWSLLRRDK